MQQIVSNFAAYADPDGRIFSQTFQGCQHIGWTTAKYSELEKLANDAAEKAESYRKQLIEAGLIQPVLSTEEQIAALTKQVAALAAQNSAMASQMSGLADLLTSPSQSKEQS